MPDVELRSKTELTSIVGTEKNYTQEAGSPFTVKWWSFNTLKTWILTWVYPVGRFYIQYPDKKLTVGVLATAQNVIDYPTLVLNQAITDADVFPTAQRPATLFGGTWVEQFNTENVFFRTAGTDYQTRTNGLSLDEIQEHKHLGQLLNASNGTGGDSINQDGGVATASQNNLVGPVRSSDASHRVGAVTEPRNRLMKLWKRTVL